jgi:hypothetical protein
MASSINADNGVVSGSAGLKSTADSTGVLALQTNGTTAISIDASQAVSFTNSPTVTGGTANGVAYLNGSKVLTTGSALSFSGSALAVTGTLSATGGGLLGNAITAIKNADATVALRVGVGVDQNAALNAGAGMDFSYSAATGSVLVSIDRVAGYKNFSLDGLAINLNTSGTTRAAISSTGLAVTGTLGVTTTIGVGAATPSTSGAGITFPATQSASTDANTLDDYEEGTFTPGAGTQGGSDFTITSQVGSYTKIGNTVNVRVIIIYSGVGSGTIVVINLPPGLALDTTYPVNGFGGVQDSGSPFPIKNIQIQGYSTSQVFLKFIVGATAYYTAASELYASGVISFNATYKVS